MTQYIDKSALVTQIEKTEEISKDAADKAVDTYFKIHFDGWVTACRSILSFIDTLEVTESPAGAFIEKAEKYLQEHLLDYWSQCVTDESNFIEDFKTYMKVE